MVVVVLGDAEVVQTSLLLLTLNSEQELGETKTDQEKSMGVVYSKELARDVHPLAGREWRGGLTSGLAWKLRRFSAFLFIILLKMVALTKKVGKWHCSQQVITN